VPTNGWTAAFGPDHRRLSGEQRKAFAVAVGKLVEGLERGSIRKGLRVKGVQTAPGIFELTWAPDGRATFEFGEPVREDDPHIIWRRIGTHNVLDRP